VEILASRYCIFRDTRSEKRVLRSSFDRERERERERILEILKVRYIAQDINSIVQSNIVESLASKDITYLETHGVRNEFYDRRSTQRERERENFRNIES
jgi:hypothetical protein